MAYKSDFSLCTSFCLPFQVYRILFHFLLCLCFGNFLHEYYIYIISTPFLSPFNFFVHFLTLFLIHNLVFFNSVIHAHMHMHESIYCCLYVHVFKADLLGLENLLGNSSLEKINSSLSSHGLHAAFHIGEEPREFPHPHWYVNGYSHCADLV